MEQQQKKSSKILIPIIILLVLLVGVNVWYFFFTDKDLSCSKNSAPAVTNTVTNTNTSSFGVADWQEYTNIKEGYSINLPGNWLSDDSEEGAVYIYPSDVIAATKVNDKKNGLAIVPSVPTLDLENVSSQETVLINDITVIKGKSGTGNSTLIVAYFKKGINNYVRISWPEASDFTTDKEQILTTLDFTDKKGKWQTYTNDTFGFSFKYPPGTQVSYYENQGSISMARVVSLANPNKDSGPYSGGVGPGPIGILVYNWTGDLKAFAEDMVSDSLEAEAAEVAGIEGFRVQGILDASKNRVVGSQTAKTDHFYINYNAATWGFQFDAKEEFADQTPSHDDFLILLKTLEFEKKGELSE